MAQPSPLRIAHISRGCIEFAVIRFPDGNYALTRDGWLFDDQRWDSKNLPAALMACLHAADPTGPLVVVFQGHDPSLN